MDEALASVDATLSAVKDQLSVFDEKTMEEYIGDLAPIEKAKVQVSLGMKTLTSLTISSLTL